MFVPVLRALARGALAIPVGRKRPKNDRGVLLDEQTHAVLTLLDRAGGLSLDELGPERARIESERLRPLSALAPEALYRIEDELIETDAATIRIRTSRPRGGPERLPATVFFHGGGFVIGSLASHDALCRRLAVRSGSIVVAVDYRLAPEHPFPAATEDAYHGYEWVRANAEQLGIDATRIAVAGDSAGGNLAAVVCQLRRARGVAPPRFQLLIYPALDFTRSSDSHRAFATGFLLTERTLDFFVANYLEDASAERDPRASPLVTSDLAGLPPAHVVTAGFDPLRDEGEAYARALMAAGVPTTLRCYDSLVHAFADLGGLVEAAARGVDDMGDVLHRHLWG